jgi:hypothetical protein
MRKFAAAACTVAIAFGACAPASAKWDINRSAAAIDGAKRYTATATSENTLFNILDQPQAAKLFVTCNKGTPGVVIDWPDFFPTYETEAVWVEWKVDDAKITKVAWPFAENAVGPTHRDAAEFFRKIADGHRLIFRIQDRHGAQEAIFDIGDATAVKADLLAEGCKI